MNGFTRTAVVVGGAPGWLKKNKAFVEITFYFLIRLNLSSNQARMDTIIPKLANQASGYAYATRLPYKTMAEAVKPYKGTPHETRMAAVTAIKAALTGTSKEARMVGDQLIIMLDLGTYATLTSAERGFLGLY